MRRARPTFGKYLWECRNKAGLTQGAVAKVFRYTTAQFVSNWENDKSRPPTSAMVKLSRLYKISAEEFISILISDYEAKLRKAFRSPSTKN
jgi:transcriptional regulator with XRE-family HTH domain